MYVVDSEQENEVSQNKLKEFLKVIKLYLLYGYYIIIQNIFRMFPK